MNDKKHRSHLTNVLIRGPLRLEGGSTQSLSDEISSGIKRLWIVGVVSMWNFYAKNLAYRRKWAIDVSFRGYVSRYDFGGTLWQRLTSEYYRITVKKFRWVVLPSPLKLFEYMAVGKWLLPVTCLRSDSRILRFIYVLPHLPGSLARLLPVYRNSN